MYPSELALALHYKPLLMLQHYERPSHSTENLILGSMIFCTVSFYVVFSSKFFLHAFGAVGTHYVVSGLAICSKKNKQKDQ